MKQCIDCKWYNPVVLGNTWHHCLSPNLMIGAPDTLPRYCDDERRMRGRCTPLAFNFEQKEQGK